MPGGGCRAWRKSCQTPSFLLVVTVTRGSSARAQELSKGVVMNPLQKSLAWSGTWTITLAPVFCLLWKVPPAAIVGYVLGASATAAAALFADQAASAAQERAGRRATGSASTRTRRNTRIGVRVSVPQLDEDCDSPCLADFHPIHPEGGSIADCLDLEKHVKQTGRRDRRSFLGSDASLTRAEPMEAC